ncbi:MAG: copper chaperone PCu(A)C [Hyphomonadaceae bacterium]|nr:copper chaperone PCu(A)C [Hyphomonadaceae bacterium]
MKALIPLFLIALAAACGAPVQSASTATDAPASAEVVLHDAWAAPTPQGVDVAAGYLTISNGTGGDDRLVGATSPRAERVEVHEMAMNGAVMQMRPVPQLTIPAGQDVQLAPGGMHLMFYGVAEPFVEGQEIPVQLSFETAGTIDVTLPVRRMGASTEHGAGHGN